MKISMVLPLLVGGALAGGLLPSARAAGPRSSASYFGLTETVDAGGRRSTSASYSADGSLGGLGAVSTATTTATVAKSGYPGQLYEITALALTSPSPTVNENATLALGARWLLGDGTFLSLAASTAAWSVGSGPLTGVSVGGVVTAGPVYANTPASVLGNAGGFSASLNLTVLDTVPDNFGPYAGDHIADSWQAQYFGANNPSGAASADPDGDGLTNLQEFAFGTDPTAVTTAVAFSGNSLVHPGLPDAWVQVADTGADYRAVFSRRKDYAAQGLSYTVEFSADLMTWQSSSATPSPVASDASAEAVSVPYPFFVNGRKARFFRVRVTTSP